MGRGRGPPPHSSHCFCPSHRLRQPLQYLILLAPVDCVCSVFQQATVCNSWIQYYKDTATLLQTLTQICSDFDQATLCTSRLILLHQYLLLYDVFLHQAHHYLRLMLIAAQICTVFAKTVLPSGAMILSSSTYNFKSKCKTPIIQKLPY